MFLLPGRTPPERGGAACGQQSPASANATRLGFSRSLRQRRTARGRYRNSPIHPISEAELTLSPCHQPSQGRRASPPARPTLHPCKRERHNFLPQENKCWQTQNSLCASSRELTFTGFPVHEISCIKRAVEQVLHLEDKGYNPQGKEDWHCSKPRAKRNKVPANKHNSKGSFRGW